MGMFLIALKRALVPSIRCGWCGQETVEGATRAYGAWYCTPEHARLDFEMSAP